MPRVTADHVQIVKKTVVTMERSTNRGITDTLSCLLAMQGERTDARVFVDVRSIDAMRLVAESLDLQLKSQARIAQAHAVMTDLIGFFDVPGFGPGTCVPNTPGAQSDALPVKAGLETLPAD